MGCGVVSYNHGAVIEKINKLKYRITFATHGTQEPTELKDVAIVGGILGTIIWYIKGKNA